MAVIHISPLAKHDLLCIKQYIKDERNSPKAAARISAKIMKSIRQLARHPASGAPLSSIVSLETDYRFLVSANYLTFYTLKGDNVYVMRVVHGEQDFIRILFGQTVRQSLEEIDHER